MRKGKEKGKAKGKDKHYKPMEGTDLPLAHEAFDENIDNVDISNRNIVNGNNDATLQAGNNSSLIDEDCNSQPEALEYVH